MATTITAGAPANHRETAESVSLPHDLAIRRIMGAAYARIAASGERVKHALRLHHSAVSQRKNGSGPMATAGVEIDALERAEINTDPLTDAFERIKLAARGPVCVTTAIRSEAEADAAEDIAAAEYAIGVPGSAERWAEQLIAQARASTRLAQSLLAGKVAR